MWVADCWFVTGVAADDLPELWSHAYPTVAPDGRLLEPTHAFRFVYEQDRWFTEIFVRHTNCDDPDCPIDRWP